MAFLVVLVLLGFGTGVYLSQNPLRRVDLPLLLFSFSLVFFLSRFNGLVTIWLGPYPLSGIHIYLALALALLGMVRLLGERPHAPLVALPLPYLAGFAILTLLSGGLNGGFDGLLAAVQVLFITIVPALLAWVFVELIGWRVADSEALRRQYILPLGVVTPLILLVSALVPSVFSGLLGWQPSADFGGFEGFTRGWSPLGSTILTGTLVVVAFGFAIHEAVAKRSVLHRLVAAVAAGSILFTASRAVMIIFVLFNLIYWVLLRRWRLFWRVASLPLLAILLLVAGSLATGTISFKRFVVLNDASTGRRAETALAALDLARQRPLIGYGPGQIYHEMRTIWIANPRHIPIVMEKAIDHRLSALEPHNLYLYLAAEHGLLAGLCFVLAMVVGLVVVWRTPPGGDEIWRSERAVYIGLWCGLLIIFGTVSWPLLNPQFAFFFWLFVFSGLHCAAAQRRRVAS